MLLLVLALLCASLSLSSGSVQVQVTPRSTKNICHSDLPGATSIIVRVTNTRPAFCGRSVNYNLLWEGAGEDDRVDFGETDTASLYRVAQDGQGTWRVKNNQKFCDLKVVAECTSEVIADAVGQCEESEYCARCGGGESCPAGSTPMSPDQLPAAGASSCCACRHREWGDGPSFFCSASAAPSPSSTSVPSQSQTSSQTQTPRPKASRSSTPLPTPSSSASPSGVRCESHPLPCQCLAPLCGWSSTHRECLSTDPSEYQLLNLTQAPFTTCIECPTFVDCNDDASCIDYGCGHDLSTMTCSCDESCVERRRCCSDYHAVCLEKESCTSHLSCEDNYFCSRRLEVCEGCIGEDGDEQCGVAESIDGNCFTCEVDELHAVFHGFTYAVTAASTVLFCCIGCIASCRYCSNDTIGWTEITGHTTDTGPGLALTEEHKQESRRQCSILSWLSDPKTFWELYEKELESMTDHDLCGHIWFMVCLANDFHKKKMNKQLSLITAYLERRLEQEPSILQTLHYLRLAGTEADNLIDVDLRTSTVYPSRDFFEHIQHYIRDHPDDARGAWFTVTPNSLVADSDTIVYNPLFPAEILTGAMVVAVFSSATRPALLELTLISKTDLMQAGEEKRKRKIRRLQQRRNEFKRRVIVKAGDDLRIDRGVMLMMSVMNHLWASDKTLKVFDIPVHTILYECLSLGDDREGVSFGVMEFVQQTMPLKDINQWQAKYAVNLAQRQHDPTHTLIASTAGALLAHVILGIRDRHLDNWLLLPNGTLFLIDFGFVFGDAPWLDTGAIAVHINFFNVIGQNNFQRLVELTTRGYLHLRKPENSKLLIRMADLAFNSTNKSGSAATYVEQQLRLNETEDEARAWLMSELKKAPSNLTTAAKNTARAAKDNIAKVKKAAGL